MTHGGARPGAGRPLEAVLVRRDEEWHATSKHPDTGTSYALATVTLRKRDRNWFRLTLSDGTELELRRAEEK